MSEPTTEISAARLAANRANALKSTGPRSDRGKSASRLNGLTHGMRAELPILPGEDPEALQARLDACADEFAPETETELRLVATMVQASWRMDRCRGSETAALTQQVLDAGEAFDDRKAEEVEQAIPRLADDPAGVVRQLRKSSRGCGWLIERWAVLGARLQAYLSFEPTQRQLAIRLLGRDPRAMFSDPIVHHWTFLSLASLLGNADVSVERARPVLLRDCPEDMKPNEFDRQLQVTIPTLPDQRQAHATLKELVKQALAELAERRELLAEREERDRALAVERAAFDDSKGGAARLRYEMAHHRVFSKALHDLRGMQKDRQAQARTPSVAPTAPAAPTEPRPPTPELPAIGARSEAAPTEPKPITPRSTSAAPTEPDPADPGAPTGLIGDSGATSDAPRRTRTAARAA